MRARRGTRNDPLPVQWTLGKQFTEVVLGDSRVAPAVIARDSVPDTPVPGLSKQAWPPRANRQVRRRTVSRAFFRGRMSALDREHRSLTIGWLLPALDYAYARGSRTPTTTSLLLSTAVEETEHENDP
jgi:hypothetical protein